MASGVRSLFMVRLLRTKVSVSKRWDVVAVSFFFYLVSLGGMRLVYVLMCLGIDGGGR